MPTKHVLRKSRRQTKKRVKPSKKHSRKQARRQSRRQPRKQSRKQNGGGEYDEYCELCQLPLYSPGQTIDLYEEDNYSKEPVKAILSVDTEWMNILIGEDTSEEREGMTYDLIDYGGSGYCHFAPEQSNPDAQAIIDGSKGHIVGYPTREVKIFHVTNQSGNRNNDDPNNARYMLQGTVYHKDCYNAQNEASKKARKAMEFQDQFYDWSNAYRTHGEDLFASPLLEPEQA